MEQPQWIPLQPRVGQVNGMINAVFPILKQRDDDDWVILGTGFFVTHYGLFFTAAHLFEGRDIDLDRDQFFMPHLLPEERSNILRRIVWICSHGTTDIAVGLVEQKHQHENDDPINNHALLLVTVTPAVGEIIFSYGHPCSEIISITQDGDRAIILQQLSTTGIVSQHFPNGRDRIMQPGCCIETNLESYGGSSGSPVIDRHGRVFAVVSSGLGEQITYAAPIEEILDAPIPSIFASNQNDTYCVRDCVPFVGSAPIPMVIDI